MKGKIRVLWLCNIIIPQAAAKLGINTGTGGGWVKKLSGIFDKTKENAYYINKGTVPQ